MTAQADVKRYELLIGGEAVAPGGGAYSTILDPSTEAPIASVAQGTAADVDRAVQAARAALKPWNAIRAAERGRILMRFAELMRTHQEEIAAVESLDGGKPISGVRRQDIAAAIDTLEYDAGWCHKINGQVVPVRPDGLTYTLREPVGVVAAIGPWNFPLMIGMWKIAPALACGCTLVVKPAEITPLSALRIGELALEAGVPPGVLKMGTGRGRGVGDALVGHPGIDKVTFTGSPSVGRGILQGATSNFKRVTLELGGKSANLIFDDANLDNAVRAAASGVFFNTGQVCSAGSRILVHRNVYDDVVKRLAAHAKSIRVGDPAQRETTMGPLISAAQMKTVLDYVDVGKSEGASLVTGGARIGECGFFVEPTVVANGEHEKRISQEEIFRPGARLIRFES